MFKKEKKEDKRDFFKVDELPSKWKMRKRINSLENEVETLKEIIKSELYKEFMKKLGEHDELERLRNENKNLRKKYKEERKYGNSCSKERKRRK